MMKRYIGLLLMALTLLGAGEGNVTKSQKPAAWINGRDPVYLVDLKKYPKFSAKMLLKNGKTIEFASVKSMLNFYYHPEKYPGFGVRDRRQIGEMFVKDYLDGTEIPLRQAWYVFGSRIVGPHGDDLIPLSSKARAELFTKRYGGTKIMSFKELGEKGYGLIRYLDM